MNLSQEHIKVLKNESSINQDVMKLAELSSASIAEAKSKVGWSAPGILFPYFNLTGKTLGYRLRFDTPQKSSEGKPVRYMQKSNTDLKCYFIPSTKEQLLDPKVPICVTEGEKKLLSLYSALGTEKFAFAAYPGCWNWKKKEQKQLGGEWEQIPFANRKVILIPDTDFFYNASVFSAISSFIKILCRLGAKVQLIDLREEDSE